MRPCPRRGPGWRKGGDHTFWKYVFSQEQVLLFIRQRGSHVRMKSDDGRYTPVPVHSGEDLPKGLLQKIIREDLEMTPEDVALHMKYTRGIKAPSSLS
jgi:hypothetical protein